MYARCDELFNALNLHEKRSVGITGHTRVGPAFLNVFNSRLLLSIFESNLFLPIPTVCIILLLLAVLAKAARNVTPRRTTPVESIRENIT